MHVMKKNATQPWTQITDSTQYECFCENMLVNILPLIWNVILSVKSETSLKWGNCIVCEKSFVVSI